MPRKRRACGSMMVSAIVSAITVTLWASSAWANFDATLQLMVSGQEVIGENTQVGREGTIQLLSLSNSVAIVPGTGARVHQPITIVKLVDQTTPRITLALTNNEQVEAYFRVYRPGSGGPENYYTIHITGGRVSAISSAAGEADGQLRELVSFSFSQITWTYEPTGATGTDTLQ